jgi:hypothetical protein
MKPLPRQGSIGTEQVLIMRSFTFAFPNPQQVLVMLERATRATQTNASLDVALTSKSGINVEMNGTAFSQSAWTEITLMTTLLTPSLP